ncbi:MAG: HD domain-containing protein [Candidatus Omnitrophica bacterium]|nr:HD domain-containing protein [Candidatus Omnitrophota bacterium]
MLEFHKGFEGEEKLGAQAGKGKDKGREISDLSLSPYVDDAVRGKPVSDPEKAQGLYDGILAYVREVFDKVLEGKEGEIDHEGLLKRTDEYTEKFMNMPSPSDLVYLAFRNGDYRDNYIYTHSVNVCLLCVRLALGLHYSRVRMAELVTAALFHDIGMMKIPVHDWNKDSELGPSAFQKVTEHPLLGEEILKEVKGMPEVVPVIVAQHQEKLDGTGYPKGLQKEEIHYMARLLGIVNRYEAETHDRLWRKKTLPDAAVQDILDEEGGAYDQHFLKAILRHISIFPVGSWVQISSGEIGNVIKVNEDTPMRPVINVVFSRDRKKLEDHRVLDLSKQLLIHVERCVDEDTLEGV